ncbi:MAG: fumarate reductase flavoprotein subunit [Burkholderiaceae bacterium]
MKVIYTDVLVIGGGLAGLRLAVGAKRRGHDAIILSLVPAKRSHSKAAQGGMQASLGNVIKGQGDNEDVHFGDTVRGSDWGADQDVVRMFVNTAPKAVRELAAWGVPWSRIQQGDRQVIINGEKVTITERGAAQGLIGQRDFGGTKKWRTCFVSDGTGHAMLNAVTDRAIAESIPVHERVEAIALIHDGARCFGAVVRDLITGELVAYVAKATAITTGGAGKVFQVTTNAVICEGIGHALALETGVATLGNMEAVQFHPTGIFPAGILVTEGCRGDGGLLRDVDGHRFMPDVEPEKKELASRDVVSRRMEERIAQGKGAKSRFGEHLWLDITLLGEHHIKHSLREVYEICHYFLGVDPTKQWIPVRPAQHYTMGGVRTHHTGESRQLKGLFSAGEAACWDMHGFNRLGGNSVAETVVAGMIVGEFVADFCERPENEIDIPTSTVYDFVKREQAKLDELASGRGTEDATALRTRMQEIMTAKVGIFRRGKDLEEAVTELEQLLVRSRNIGVKNVAGANPELATAYRTQKMLKVALTMAFGAMTRTESRGAHFREDFPVRNDAEWLKRTLSSWKNDNDTLPTLSYENLEIGKMELPPGWRGYGAKNYIDNAATAERQAQVDAITQDLQAKGADRFAIQEALLPYQQQLPAELRGKNERIDERF